MFDACVWTVDTHVQKHTQRWRHAPKAWMLFSYSFSCSEQKVFPLVAFDPTEMPYICQRKGDPTGTVQQSYPHDVILSLSSHPLFLSRCHRLSISSLPLALILSAHFPSILFLRFLRFCHVPLSCVCFGDSLIVFSAVQSTGIKVLFCRPMPFFICWCTSHAGCSIITNNKMTGFYMFDMWMCVCVCECNAQMCAAGVCVWKNCCCAGISVLMPLSYSAPYQPLSTFLQTNAWAVCVCVCLLVCLAMPE